MKTKIFSTLILLFIATISWGQSSPVIKDSGLEEMNKAIEEMMREFNIPMDSMALNKLFDPKNQNSFFLSDSNQVFGFFNNDFEDMMSDMFTDSINTEAFNKIFEQGLQMFQSMDEKQMEDLLNSFDFSQMDKMMHGFDMNALDEILKGFELQIPDNYFDSLQNIQKTEPQKKKLRRI